MKPGIDPKVDYAFKKVFGSEANTDLLKDLLEAVLGFAISDVEITNPFNDKATSDDKLSILDIKAKDAEGRWFDVEMQMVAHVAVLPRMLYYWGKLYTGQLTEGEVFDELRPAYTICFIDSKLFHRKPEVYLNRFGAFDPATGEVMSNHFNVYIVELPKFVRGANEVGTTLESWCYYFEHGASLDPEHLPATLDRPPVRKAMEVLMRMSQDAIERDRYESRLKYRRDMQQFERDAATAMERGEEKGRKEGRKAGREEGELYGEIRTFQLVLKQPQTPKQDLEKMSLDELQRLAVELQRQVNSGK